MEGIPTEAWIIMYTWSKPEDWIGAFPSELYQWFVCQYKESKLPRIFDSKNECDDYIKDGALIDAVPIQVAGGLVKLYNEVPALPMLGVSVSYF
jgi:hypothetical protein